MKKMIVVESCTVCPKRMTCKAIINLTREQYFDLIKTPLIPPDCPLPDMPEDKATSVPDFLRVAPEKDVMEWANGIPTDTLRQFRKADFERMPEYLKIYCQQRILG